MSTGPAASPAPRRDPAAARTATGRPRLALVPSLPTNAPRAPFMVLVGALLTLGLGGLLFVHTALAEDSFRLHDLKERSQVLADREQALEQEIDVAASPKRLAQRASVLGMVPSENPAFIRISDGRILGRPKAGVAPPPPVTVTTQQSADQSDHEAQDSATAAERDAAAEPRGSGESANRRDDGPARPGDGR